MSEFKFKKEDAPPSEEEKKDEEKKEEAEESQAEKSAKTSVKKEGEERKEEEKKEEKEKEDEAEKSAPEGFVKAADLDAIIKSAVSSAVTKAVAPLQEQIDKQTTQIRKSELEHIAKSDLDGIGQPAEVADALFQIEKSNLPNSTKDSIYKMFRSAAVVKKEAGKYLFNPMGANMPAPGSAAEEFEGLVKKEMEQIRKSADAPKDQKVLRAQAVQKVSVANPELVKKYQSEEKADSFRSLMGVS